MEVTEWCLYKEKLNRLTLEKEILDMLQNYTWKGDDK